MTIDSPALNGAMEPMIPEDFCICVRRSGEWEAAPPGSLAHQRVGRSAECYNNVAIWEQTFLIGSCSIKDTSRDGKKRFPEIVYGLLCNSQGCPIAIEVFAGNTAAPNTLESQVNKVIKRFGVKRTVLLIP